MIKERVTPCSIKAECALIGSVLLYNNEYNLIKDVFEANIEDDFYDNKNQSLIKALLNMYQRNVGIDYNTIQDELNNRQILEKCGGLEHIKQCVKACESNEIKSYIEMIQSTATLRRLIEVSDEIKNIGYDNQNEMTELLNKAEDALFKVTRVNKSVNFTSIKEIIEENVKKIGEIQAKGEDLTGISTGFTYLDKLTNGLQNGDLIILAARPSMGKTAFALNIALNAAKNLKSSITPENKQTVAIFSLEMPKEAIVNRMLSCDSQVESSYLKNGDLNDLSWSRINNSKHKLSSLSIVIDDTPGISISEIATKCRALKKNSGLSLIVIDYLQLITINAGKHIDSRQQAVSEISRRLKVIARELNVPLIALSQLSRSVERTEDKRPKLSDLRDSGAIEQDADIVMFLYRDNYYERKEMDSEEVELNIAKHRNGATSAMSLAFEKSISCFKNLNRKEKYEN